jgi:hypothetical protein
MSHTPTFPPDPVIEAYKKDVDVSLLIENLKRTPHERLLAMISMLELTKHLRVSIRSAK